jgi:hypothetical protein
MDVGYDFALDKVKDILNGQGVTRVKATDCTIDGRPGKVFRGRKDRSVQVVAAVLRDETLVLVGSRLAEGESDDVLQKVLDSLDLDE